MRVNMLGADFRFQRSPSYTRRSNRNPVSAVPLGESYRYERTPSYARRTGRNRKSAVMGESFRYERSPSYSRRHGRIGESYDAPWFTLNSPSVEDIESRVSENLEKAAKEKQAEEQQTGFWSKSGDYFKELFEIAAREGAGVLKEHARTPEQKQVAADVEKAVRTRNIMIGGGIAAAAVVAVILINR